MRKLTYVAAALAAGAVLLAAPFKSAPPAKATAGAGPQDAQKAILAAFDRYDVVAGASPNDIFLDLIRNPAFPRQGRRHRRRVRQLALPAPSGPLHRGPGRAAGRRTPGVAVAATVLDTAYIAELRRRAAAVQDPPGGLMHPETFFQRELESGALEFGS